jgi:hypothetical protein
MLLRRVADSTGQITAGILRNSNSVRQIVGELLNFNLPHIRQPLIPPGSLRRPVPCIPAQPPLPLEMPNPAGKPRQPAVTAKPTQRVAADCKPQQIPVGQVMSHDAALLSSRQPIR